MVENKRNKVLLSKELVEVVENNKDILKPRILQGWVSLLDGAFVENQVLKYIKKLDKELHQKEILTESQKIIETYVRGERRFDIGDNRETTKQASVFRRFMYGFIPAATLGILLVGGFSLTLRQADGKSANDYGFVKPTTSTDDKVKSNTLTDAVLGKPVSADETKEPVHNPMVEAGIIEETSYKPEVGVKEEPLTVPLESNVVNNTWVSPETPALTYLAPSVTQPLTAVLENQSESEPSVEVPASPTETVETGEPSEVASSETSQTAVSEASSSEPETSGSNTATSETKPSDGTSSSTELSESFKN